MLYSVLDYCAPIVYPSYSLSSIEKLQKVQNKALRLATGCHTLAAIEHLHAEAQELTVENHLRLLSDQFLARSLQPDHVSYPYTSLDQGPRRLRHTLRLKCLADIEPYLEADGTVSRGKFPAIKKQLHTDIVGQAIDSLGPNRVLGRSPPPIDASETSLPRITRVTLSQLRSGHCVKLRDLQLRLGKTLDDICPDCSLFPQTVAHLFDCPAHPTTLDVSALWEAPRDAADHIRSFAAFDLPPLGTPPRPARRRRPPAAPPDSPVFSPLVPPPSPPLIRPLMPLRGSSSYSSLSPRRLFSPGSSSLHSRVNSESSILSDMDLFL